MQKFNDHNASQADIRSTPPPDFELPYGLNIDDFWHDMDDWEASDELKLEWLIALAHIVKGFVDWGLGQDTVQMILAQNFVDSFDQTETEAIPDSVNMLEQQGSPSVTKAVTDVTGKAGSND